MFGCGDISHPEVRGVKILPQLKWLYYYLYARCVVIKGIVLVAKKLFIIHLRENCVKQKNKRLLPLKVRIEIFSDKRKENDLHRKLSISLGLQ